MGASPFWETGAPLEGASLYTADPLGRGIFDRMPGMDFPAMSISVAGGISSDALSDLLKKMCLSEFIPKGVKVSGNECRPFIGERGTGCRRS